MNDMDYSRKRHRKSWDGPGGAHCLTFSCFHDQDLLRSDQKAKWFLELIARAREKGLFALWAYAVMPEHAHIVLLPKDTVQVATILWQLKRPMTRRVVRWAELHDRAFLAQMIDRQPSGKTSRRFWQRGGGYDRNLRSVSDVHEKIRYVHANPVRRGLVSRPEDWPYSSARAWATERDDPIPIDRDSLPPRVSF